MQLTSPISPNKVATIGKTSEGYFFFRFTFQDYSQMREETQERLRELALFDSSKKAWLAEDAASARVVVNLLKAAGFTLIFQAETRKLIEEIKKKIETAKQRLKALKEKPWLAFVKKVNISEKNTFAENGNGQPIIVFRIERTPGDILRMGIKRTIKGKTKEYIYWQPTKEALQALCKKHPSLVKWYKEKTEKKLREFIETLSLSHSL